MALFLGSAASLMADSLQPLQLLVASEALFFLYCLLVHNLFLKQPVPVERWKHDREWRSTWKMALRSVPDAKEWFASWFVDPKISFSDIKREDAADLITWAMFGTTWAALSEEQQGEVARTLFQFEKLVGSSFPKRGENEKPLKSMRNTIEPIRFFHKPLTFYAITQGIFGMSLKTDMTNMGFEEHWNGSFRYFLFKQPVPTQQQQQQEKQEKQEKKGPIVLFHGVGGLAAYSSFVRGLKSLGRDVVCIEMSYVSLHVAPDVPTIDEHVSMYRSIMEKNGYAGKKSVLIGHSYGTNVVTWLVKALGNAHVETAVFLDPVNFMLHLSHIASTWFYSGRSLADLQVSPVLSVASLFSLVKTELFVANSLQRGQVWHRNALFAEELQKEGINSLVVLSSNDHITPCAAVKDHFAALESECQREGNDMVVQSHTLEGANHGQLVITERYRLETIRLIKAALLKASPELNGRLPATSSTSTSSRSKVVHFATGPQQRTRSAFLQRVPMPLST